jgi:DnaJ-class molecular chaperone
MTTPNFKAVLADIRELRDEDFRFGLRYVDCPRCNGTGRGVLFKVCPACDGDGIVLFEEDEE